MLEQVTIRRRGNKSPIDTSKQATGTSSGSLPHSEGTLPAARISPVSVLSEQVELQVDERPPEGTIVVASAVRALSELGPSIVVRGGSRLR